MLFFLGCYNYNNKFVKNVDKNKAENLRCYYAIADMENKAIYCYTAYELEQIYNKLTVKGKPRFTVEGLVINVFGKVSSWSDNIDNVIATAFDTCIYIKDSTFKLVRLLYSATFQIGPCYIKNSYDNCDCVDIRLVAPVSQQYTIFDNVMHNCKVNSINMDGFYDLPILDLRPYDNSNFRDLRCIVKHCSNIEQLYFGNLNLNKIKFFMNLDVSNIKLRLIDFSNSLFDFEPNQKHNKDCFKIQLTFCEFCTILLNKKTLLFNKRIISELHLSQLEFTINKSGNVLQQIEKGKAKQVLLGTTFKKYNYLML